MGLISGIQAITAVQKIKQGGTAKLSIAQIAELIINLPDAQKIRQKINLTRFMTFITSTKNAKRNCHTITKPMLQLPLKLSSCLMLSLRMKNIAAEMSWNFPIL